MTTWVAPKVAKGMADMMSRRRQEDKVVVKLQQYD
jgi:hypothetical protein